ncbi:hypothetical protein E8E95_00900 [Pseudomonas sp. BN414]|uniref:hypothetical protein n=1 Tax=unclassified Pseudomonas TaxID=196821 RepID=UPI0024590BE7|nr:MULTISPECIES: hypothetical protein [unclassified Pseudomonas]MDH4565244.1 hypothetical protein [Pseudomonas sp. BN414]
MSRLDDLEAFLHSQPGMALKPSQDGCVHIKGRLRFSASYEGSPTVVDSFQLHIKISQQIKDQLPEVYEIGGRIPSDGNHHINPNGTICLGAPIRLHMILGKSFTLAKFIDRCVIPFLYAISLAEKGHERFKLGELAHGAMGLVEDYIKLFSCSSRTEVQRYLQTLIQKKRLANKKRCPCNCGRKLVKCRTHNTMVALRVAVPKRLLKDTLAEI